MRKNIPTKIVFGKIMTQKQKGGARKKIQKNIDVYCTGAQDLTYHSGHIISIRFKENFLDVRRNSMNLVKIGWVCRHECFLSIMMS